MTIPGVFDMNASLQSITTEIKHSYTNWGKFSGAVNRVYGRSECGISRHYCKTSISNYIGSSTSFRIKKVLQRPTPHIQMKSTFLSSCQHQCSCELPFDYRSIECPKSCDPNVRAYSFKNLRPFELFLGGHNATVNHSRIQSSKIRNPIIQDHALLPLFWLSLFL